MMGDKRSWVMFAQREVEMKNDANLMQRAHAAPRCTARAKSTGTICRSPAVAGWLVCRMHGAKGGAVLGPDNVNHKHGLRSKGYLALRKYSMRKKEF